VLQKGFTAEYEEGVVFFDNASEFQGTFVRCFDNAPIVTYALESGSDGVNIFGVETPSTTNFRVGSSAPFTGYVRYRAAALNPGTPYPKFVDCPTGGTTGSFWIAAGTCSLDSTLTQFTASWNALPYTPATDVLEFRLEAHDAYSNSGSNVAFEIDEIHSSGALGKITAELSDVIHFHATTARDSA